MLELFRKFIILAVCSSIAACAADKSKGKACYTQRALPEEAASVIVASDAQVADEKVLPGSYLVAFRSQPGGPGLGFRSFASEHSAHFNFLVDAVGADPRLSNLRFLTSLDLSPALKEDESAEFNPSPLMRLAWSEGGSHEPMIATLAQVDFQTADAGAEALADWDERGLLWFAEPNYVSRLSQEPVPNLFGDLATNYGKFNYWWLQKIRLTEAYSAIGSRDLAVPDTPTDQALAENRPIVAILDSGVDYEHPALKDRIWINSDPNAAGCKDDIHGCDTTTASTKNLGSGDVWPFDTTGPGQSCIGRDTNCSHGTHVAGIIAADSKWADPEGRPTAGVCPVCQIMILKIVSKVGKDSGILDSSIIAAFKYVSRFERQGVKAVRVINASFGKFVRSRSVGLLIRLLREKNDTLVVAAAGNEDTLSMEFPAAFNDAIAVAAVDSQLRKVSFSNFGRWVDIAAPGSAILSTVPGSAVDSKSGTSMAAPMVAGVAGLMLARFPNLSFSELRRSLIDGADPELYKLTSGGGYNSDCYYPEVPQEDIRQPLLGTGLLNASAAVSRAPAQDLPIFTNLDRVRRGCSVVGEGGQKSPSWLFALPMVFALIYATSLRCVGKTKGR